MSGFPGSPRTLRGAVVAVDSSGPLSRLVVFQYNPDQIVRTLRPRGPAPAHQVSAADAHRLWGAPVETISLTVSVDATDQLEHGDPMAALSGVAPQLAALEMLLYPGTATVVENAAMLLAGTIEILPMESPLTLLIWGPGRAVPIRIESLSITEQAFSPELFPTLASVQMSAQILSYNDLSVSDPGHALFLVHQVMKETMALAAGAAAAVTVAGGAAGV
ncbi:hypothetical protein [Streptomyces sp. NPDC005476]|uniref:hypothetical protein n=1 Tax=Streptomyces sp. NPDC005476 TaxID=3156882 RepID=UPI0034535FDA